jgi:hypothetical protein
MTRRYSRLRGTDSGMSGHVGRVLCIGHDWKVRHLSRQQTLSALGRGARIEQMLNETLGGQDIRWLSVHAVDGGLALRLHQVRDEGATDFLDVTAFSPVDENEEFGEGRLLGRYGDAEAALAAAEANGGRPDRWVNAGVVQDEYADLLRAHGR